MSALSDRSQRSYHLRVECPPDLAFLDIDLLREAGAEDLQEGTEDEYHARTGPDYAQMYSTARLETADHTATVEVRVPFVGYLRAIWITSMFTAGVFLAGQVWLERLSGAADAQADAAVALLLVGPSILAAYLVRPGEHAIATRLLRPARYAIACAGLLSYVGAGCIVFGVRDAHLAVIWTILSSIAVLIAGFMSFIVVRTRKELADAASGHGLTRPGRVIVF